MDSSIAAVLNARDSALQAQIATRLMAKQLDAVKVQGDAMVELVQAAANTGKQPGVGQVFDVNG